MAANYSHLSISHRPLAACFADPGQNHGWSCVGSCDNRVTDDSMTVALNSGQYQSNYCERQYVEVLDVNRGSIGRFKIADRCMGCGWGGIDFTPAGWKSLGRGMGEGSFTIKWRFV